MLKTKLQLSCHGWSSSSILSYVLIGIVVGKHTDDFL
jgi:hypothetical protein